MKLGLTYAKQRRDTAYEKAVTLTKFLDAFCFIRKES